MQAVGRLGSYISRGVYTVSGPFHPFGGAVDIVLVEQEDGSFKSSPWYVRFGKFQGVLKAKEKVVSISVNGVEANFHMYLDHKGEAFFLREVEAVEGESMIYPSFSGDETDSPTQDNKLLLNSKSCNYGSHKSNSVAKIDINNGNIVAGTNSNRSQMIGLAFGRRSIGGNNNFQGEFDNAGIKRVGSLECAEIAADLMEAKWSTNLAGDKPSRKASEKNKKSSSQRDNMENALNQLTLYEEACSHNEQEGICSKSDLEIPGGLSEEECENSSCLSTPDEVSKIFMVGESFSKEKAKVITGVSTSIDIAEDTEHDRKVMEVISDSTRCDLRAACLELEAHIEKKLSGEDVSSVSVKPGYGISEEEISADGIQSLVNGVTSESSMGGMDCSSERTHEVPYPAIGRCGDVHVHAEVLQATNFLLPEVTKIVEVGKNANLGMPKMKVSQQTDCSLPRVSKFNVVDVEDPPTLPKPRRVNLDLGLCSAEKVESNCVVTTSSYGSKGNQTLEEKNLKDEVVSSTLTSLESVSDCVLRRATSRLPSASSEDEHFFFSDFDESRFSDQCDCSISPEYVDEEDQVSYLDGIEKVNQLIDRNYSLHLSPKNCATGNQLTDLENLRVTSSPTVIPKNEDPGKEVGPQTKSLPGMYSYSNALGQHDLCYPLSHSLDSKTQFLEKPLLGKDDLKCLKSAEGKENQLLPEKPGAKDCHGSGDSSALSPSPGRNWRLWPFSFRRSTSREAMVPASYAKNTNASESTIETDANKNELKPNPLKKNARANTPTSEQLASLNLKEGRNTVTFTFSTGMLGKQQVDAQIYLWKWNTRIVISDVDGTITKSDVLGQFMPLVGVDWSQTGVAHLFSAIKENGYQLLFLSARAISQAYHTRQFLINLKQDGKVLPDGPVVISPDGLFPSLFREVIRRTPHEFKIACLEDIRALFPSDCNPFYAGFGNRDTDEISYLKVGIPKGKIFIINPKGEVAVNRRHDTKSYTSLHALVNGMFPPMNSSEQEDFNSWNYWKLPPPVIDN